MSKGVFYSVGLGPGDPELITLKAVRVIESAAVIAVPQSGGPSNMALDIAAKHIKGKPVLCCPMPMTRDEKKLNAAHSEAAALLAAELDKGLTVAFLTIGDPTIYSTAMYAHQRLSALGYDTRIIPGLPSFCAAAAALNAPLCEGDEPLFILPGGAVQQGASTTVLMKSGRALKEALLPWQELGAHISLVERASLPDQKIYHSPELPDTPGYFSLAIIKPPLPSAKEPREKQFFPLFIPSSGLKALVGGGGTVATRRVKTLCQFAFAVTVVAPHITAELAALYEEGRIQWREGEFCDDDLADCFLAVAATDNRQVNEHIGNLAKERGLWVSVADCREECNFFFPAIALGEDIVAGLISEGRSPKATVMAAQRVREVLR